MSVEPRAHLRSLPVILNPYAARNERRPQLPEHLRRCAPAVDVWLSRDFDALEAIAAELAQQRPPVVAISGGDGTLGLTLSALSRAYGHVPLPAIVPLQGGTMNMVHRSVGVVRDQCAVLRRLLSAPDQTARCPRDLMAVNDRLGFIFGFGLTANFLEAYYDGPGRGGPKAAKIVAQVVGSTLRNGPLARRTFARQPATLVIDGESMYERAWTAVLVQTIRNLGIGFRPAYRALEQPGTAHLLGTDCAAPSLVNHLGYIFRGRPWSPGMMVDELPTRLDITFAEDAPRRYTLDGELYEAAAINLRVAEQIVFLRP